MSHELKFFLTKLAALLALTPILGFGLFRYFEQVWKTNNRRKKMVNDVRAFLYVSLSKRISSVITMSVCFLLLTTLAYADTPCEDTATEIEPLKNFFLKEEDSPTVKGRQVPCRSLIDSSANSALNDRDCARAQFTHTPTEIQYYPPTKESDSSPFLFEISSSKTDDHRDLNTVKISTKPGGVKGSATVSTVTDPWADVKSARPEKSVKVKIELEHKF